MPLSEHEQRLLEQMERALYAEDPKLASTLRGSDLRAHQRRRVAVGVLGLLAGLGLLLAGVTLGWGFGLAGFLVMLASAWWMLGGFRGRGTVAAEPPAATGGTPTTKKPPKPSRGMMNRFEDRWQRRREGDDRS